MSVKYYDVMLDLETGGLSPDHSPILQIAAVRFNLKEKAISTDDMFDRCLFPLPGRQWDESTYLWWHGKNRPVLETILPRREDPELVLNDFFEWALKGYDGQEPIRMWARPSHFDWPMLDSHMKQIGKQMPSHFRYAMDMNSFIRGLGKDPMNELYYREAEGPAHNALVDVLNQIGNLFAAVEAHQK